MKRFRKHLMVVGILASSFAGGAVSHWVLSDTSQADAKVRSHAKEHSEVHLWTMTRPLITRRLTVGEPKTSRSKVIGGKITGVMDPAGMKLYDSSSRVRVRMEGASGNLALSDNSGKARISMQGTSGKLALSDSSGKARIRMEGASGNLALSDASGRDRVKFGVIKGGDTGMALLDSSGRPRVQLDSRGLKIFSSSGKEIGVFGLHKDGSMGLSVADKSGKLERIEIEKKDPAKTP